MNHKGLFQGINRRCRVTGWNWALIALVLPLVAAPSVRAESGKVTGDIRLAWQSTRGEPEAGIELRLRVAKGWHINSHQPDEAFLVPTDVVFNTPPGVEVVQVAYPEPVRRELGFAPGATLKLYEGLVTIPARVSGKPVGDSVISAVVSYQACSDTVCLRPATLRLELPLPGSSKKEGLGANTPSPGPAGMVEGWIEGGGYLYALAAVFILGLALNLTPCVYPLISVTVAYFGSQSRQGKRHWLMAVFYVLGICLTFSAMGVFAALSGSLFGAALQRPLVLLSIAGVMLLLAAGSFGLYQFRIPSALGARAGQAARGVPGALFMGLTMGLVAAPCIGPVVFGLLLFVGSRQDPVIGALFFFVMSLGLGLPYLLLAVVTESIKRMPRSGQWLEWVEKLFGFVLVGMAIYFAAPVLGDRFAGAAAAVLVAAAGVYLGFLFGRFGRRGELAKRGFGVGACAVALWLVLPGQERGRIEWQEFNPQLVGTARAQGRPAIVDFTADWCLPCREMERSTFGSDKISREARRFLMLKADVTAATPESEEWMSLFGVSGVPTIIFLRPDGEEETRALGFVGPEEFLALLRRTG